MPWSETTPVRERFLFVADVREDLFSVAELCQRYGISRKTGYKWLERFESEGPGGLEDRSRAPVSSPYRTPGEIADRVIEFRRRHPSWGPKKLISRLHHLHPRIDWPAASTAGDLLKRAGLVPARRRVRRLPEPGRTPLTLPEHPNDLWAADFKGQFRTRDTVYCYPLTVSDALTRYVLEVRALESIDSGPVHKNFQRLFREYGLPAAIRTDNGTPFASPGLGHLSRLSIWWTRLGIRVQRIAPAHPEQNGSHERMHKTLKAETARPPQANAKSQQQRFDAFRSEYNRQRPHEALGQKTPASLYQPSPRPYPKQLPQPEYPGHFEVRRVSSHGSIRFRGKRLFLSNPLAGQLVALEEIDNDLFSLFFGPLLLARFDSSTGRLNEALPT
jgi:transposase InsO family protein